MQAALEDLSCPRCAAYLAQPREGELRCTGCDCAYPIYAGIPWLFRDLESSRAQWANKQQLLAATLGGRIQQLEAALEAADLMRTTRLRLERTLEGVREQRAQIFGLLEPFALAEETPDPALPRDRIPSKQHYGSYFDTVFRDWVWGGSEIERTMRLLCSQLDFERAEQRVLILGGGAGRLSHELGQSLPRCSITQLDVNPLLTRIGALLADGERVELTETPSFPAGLENVAVRHVLGESGRKSEVRFLIGDAFTAPFRPESFDVLVTPWFIDIVPEDFRNLARRLNPLLARGGSWVSLGPLSFESHPISAQYTEEEVLEALGEAEFTVCDSRREQVSYLHSPHGTQRRDEEIFLFRAEKQGAVEAPGDFSFYPEWMRDPSLSVPRLPHWQRMQHERIFDAEILSLIDGQTSIQDIVKRLARKYSLASDRCATAVNRFFSTLFERDGNL